MLAEEYILIVPFAISYISGWTNKAEQQNIISSSLTLLSSGSGLTNHRISAQQKALAVSCKFCGNTLLKNLTIKILMTRLLFFTFLFIGTIPARAQIVGDRANKYAVQNSIDTFLIYSFPCSGGISIDSCQFDDPHYLIWQQNGGFYLKRFDYCKTYKILLLDTSNPLTFYLGNKRLIDKEEIRPPTYYEVKKNKATVDTLMVTSSVSHSCYHKYQLPLTKKPKYKYADTYDLDFKVFDNGKKNIYYNYNQKSKFKALVDMTTSLIEKLKEEKRFQED